MPLEALIGIGFAALVVLALALRKLVEWISFPCQFCEAKVRPFRKVNMEAQEAILRYFRDHERREAHQKGLFVCRYDWPVVQWASGQQSIYRRRGF